MPDDRAVVGQDFPQPAMHRNTVHFLLGSCYTSLQACRHLALKRYYRTFPFMELTWPVLSAVLSLQMAGTEMGVTEPETTFSACYGAAFLMWHPYKYASMLAEKVAKHGTQCWLVNTGWVGGAYGVGKRMSIKHTRALIDSIHSGELASSPIATTKYFNLKYPTKCAAVPVEILSPEAGWADKAAFDAKLKDLAGKFNKAMEKFKDGEKYVGVEMAKKIISGGPQV